MQLSEKTYVFSLFRGVVPTSPTRDELDAAIQAIRQLPRYENFLSKDDRSDIAAAVRAQAGRAPVYLLTTIRCSLALAMRDVPEKAKMQFSKKIAGRFPTGEPGCLTQHHLLGRLGGSSLDNSSFSVSVV